MRSSRLPGKVLLPLAGETVLAHVIHRCQAVRAASGVVVAIPDGIEDDVLADEAARAGVEIYRGSEGDVLGRYFGAASRAAAELVLRVTADCPLLDPDVAGKVVAKATETAAAYTSNNNPPSWPHGLDCECVPFAWLERANREARTPFEREHVFPYVRSHPEAMLANVPCPDGDLSHFRWTLDEGDDYRFLQEVFDRLPAGSDGYPYTVPLEICRADPLLPAINEGIGTPSYHPKHTVRPQS